VSNESRSQWPQAIGGLFCLLLVGVLSVIDALSIEYSFDVGPMAALLGTGSVLLGVPVLREAAKKITGSSDE
jgi:hypothetical protein